MWRKHRIAVAAVSTIWSSYSLNSYCQDETRHQEMAIDSKVPIKRPSDCDNPVCTSKMELFAKSMKYVKKSQNKSNTNSEDSSVGSNDKNNEHQQEMLQIFQNQHYKDCPLDKEEVGRISWALLHTIAASFPIDSELSDQDRLQLINFMQSFAYLYPCHVCGPDFQKFVKENPPLVENRTSFSLWVCELHNYVNEKLGKTAVICNIDQLDERWKYGKPSCWQFHNASGKDKDNSSSSELPNTSSIPSNITT